MSVTGDTKNISSLLQQCLLWTMSIMTLLHITFTLGPRMMDQPLSGTMTIVVAGESAHRGAYTGS